MIVYFLILINEKLHALDRCFLSLVFIMLFIFDMATKVVWSQPGPPNDQSQAPIDGGLALLLGAGAATDALRYSIWRRIEHHKGHK